MRGGKLNEDINTTFGGNTILTLDHEDGMEVSKQLRLALTSNMAKVVDLFKEWDINHDGRISKVEFRRSITRLLDERPPKEAVDALFDEMDADRGGTIEYRELYKLLRRRKSDGPRKPLWAARRRSPRRPLPRRWQTGDPWRRPRGEGKPEPVKLPPPRELCLLCRADKGGKVGAQARALRVARRAQLGACRGDTPRADDPLPDGQREAVASPRRRAHQARRQHQPHRGARPCEARVDQSIPGASGEEDTRAQPLKSAEGRQAEMIMATGAFVAHYSRPSPPPDQEGAGPSGMTTSALAARLYCDAGQPDVADAEHGRLLGDIGPLGIRRPGTAISITDEYFKPSSLLESPWNTHPERRGMAGGVHAAGGAPEKASRGASRGSGGGSPPSPGAGGPPSPGSPSRREREEIQAFPAHIPPRAMWREDVGKQIAYLRVPSSREGSEGTTRGAASHISSPTARQRPQSASRRRCARQPAPH